MNTTPESRVSQSPLILLVGSHKQSAELKHILEHYDIQSEYTRHTTVVTKARDLAPDLILLSEDQLTNKNPALLEDLGKHPNTSVIPVALWGSAEPATVPRSFRQGLVDIVNNHLSVEQTALRIAELLEELPERAGYSQGWIHNGNFDEIMHTLRDERRSGILSIRAPGALQAEAKMVIRSGYPISEHVDTFMDRLQPMFSTSEPPEYEFHESAINRLDSLLPNSKEGSAGLDVFKRLNIILLNPDNHHGVRLASTLCACGASVEVLSDYSIIRPNKLLRLDPDLFIIDPRHIEKECTTILKLFQSDVRLRWVPLLLVRDLHLLSKTGSPIRLQELAYKIKQLETPATELKRLINHGQPVDTRIEILGPTRLLRVSSSSEKKIRITIRHHHGLIEIDLKQKNLYGIKASSVLFRTEIIGIDALALTLSLNQGRVHIESHDAEKGSREIRNVMLPLDEALGRAANRIKLRLPSLPPGPLVSIGQIHNHVNYIQFIGAESSAVNYKDKSEPTSIKNHSMENGWWLQNAISRSQSMDGDGNAEIDEDELPDEYTKVGSLKAAQRQYLRTALKNAKRITAPKQVLKETDLQSNNHLDSGQGATEFISHAEIENVTHSDSKEVGQKNVDFHARISGIAIGVSDSSPEVIVESVTPPKMNSEAQMQVHADDQNKAPSASALAEQLYTIESVPSDFFDVESAEYSNRKNNREDPTLYSTEIEIPIYESKDLSLLQQPDKTIPQGQRWKQSLMRISLVLLGILSGILLFWLVATIGNLKTNITQYPTINRLFNDIYDIIHKFSDDKILKITPLQETKDISPKTADERATLYLSPMKPFQANHLDIDVIEDDSHLPSNGQTSETKPVDPPLFSETASVDDVQSASDTSDAEKRQQEINFAAELVTRGNLHRKNGEFKSAEVLYVRALHLLPSYPRAFIGMAHLKLQQKRGNEALLWTKRLVHSRPSFAMSHLLYGDALYLNGQRLKARRAWKKAALQGSAAAKKRLNTTF